MEVRAKAKYLRISPRKLRLQADLIRGKMVREAEDILLALRTKGARMLYKILQSAISNAEHNFKLKKENLFIKILTVDGGPVLKRYVPKAFGRAGGIRKPTSHITIVLSEVGEAKKDDGKVDKKEEKEKRAREEKIGQGEEKQEQGKN